jgi:hypothetical protein
MTKELINQLKKAGFPNIGSGKAPSLSGLIAACDSGFWSLRRTPEGKWLASGRFSAKEGQVPYYESTTYDEPEVAVAELYLAMKMYEAK